MAGKSPLRTPTYRRQKRPDGKILAFVNLGGRRVYLGPWGTQESRKRYGQVIAEWEAADRRLPVEPTEITVVELLAAFLRWGESYYQGPGGKVSNELGNYRCALRSVRELYGTTKAVEFGPVALKAVRQRLIDRGYTRSGINKTANRIRRVFRWGVENELLPAETIRRLECVPGLRRGRYNVAEAEPIRPVASATVDATLPYLTETVRGMVELQRLTGMRPGELCIMRACDLDTGGRVWTYRPSAHKTMHVGRDRTVFIGPKAQAVLQRYLIRQTGAYLFSPVSSEAERRAETHGRRKTPLSCGNVPGSNVKSNPRKQPRDHYDTQSYGTAIGYACERAWPAPDGVTGDDAAAWGREHRWTPNQLRHLFATEVRREHGLEASQVLLGHARADVTQIYAERDVAKAVSVVLKIG